ncbi:hypothetical protein EAO71_07080, partial [Streptomyces sp. ms191]
MSGSPEYTQYEGDPPPCDRTHQTPRGPPSGRTALLSQHPLKGVAEGRALAGQSGFWSAVLPCHGEVVHGGYGLDGVVEA